VISIALVHYESPELADRCVKSVVAHPPSEPFEVIIVDNGSSEEALAAVRRIESARVIATHRNGGFAVGVNRCFAAASVESDVVVVLNPDTEVRSHTALDQLAAAAREPRVSVAAPTLLGRTGEPERTFYRTFPTLRVAPVVLSAPLGVLIDRVARLRGGHPTELTAADLASGARPAHVMGAAMAISRAAYREVGPFDEGYFLYLEETDWQHRASDQGLHVRAVTAAEIVHLHRGGDLAAGVPSIHYVDSLQRYLVHRGASSSAVRAVLRLSLASSVAAFSLLRLLTAPSSARGQFARACLKSSREALRRASSMGDVDPVEPDIHEVRNSASDSG
jgi:GT2 family glycosyltransferase